MTEEGRAVFRVATPLFHWTVYDPSRSRLTNLINVMAALLLSPVILFVVLVAALFSRPKHRSAQEVATILSDAVQNRLTDRAWDDFTSIPIADPELDEVRKEAVMLHPSLNDKVALETLLRRTEALTGGDAPTVEAASG